MAHVNSMSPTPSPLPRRRLGSSDGVEQRDDKQQLAGTGGRVNGHARNRENRRQQYRENRSVHVATIGALVALVEILSTWTEIHSCSASWAENIEHT